MGGGVRQGVGQGTGWMTMVPACEAGRREEKRVNSNGISPCCVSIGIGEETFRQLA